MTKKGLVLVLTFLVNMGAFAEGLKEWEKGSPALIESARAIYATNCAICHGAEGKGDGAAGAALKPPARNLHQSSSQWTNGTSVKSIYVTLTEGVANTGMGGFKTIPPKDRFGLVHLIRQWVPDPQSTGKVDNRYADILKEDGYSEDGTVVKVAKKETISIDFAIRRILEEQ